MIPAIKDELQTLFPHYWITISTAQEQVGTQHYNYTTLTALDSYHFPSASSPTLHPGKQLRKGAGCHSVINGRTLALETSTKSGGKFVIINLYQFTAADPTGQAEVWETLQRWILKHPEMQIILIGDLNCAPEGGRYGYSLPLSDSLRRADTGLATFCDEAGGTLVPATHHTWIRGAQRAALDNAITWNYHLSHPQVSSLKARHKEYDHGVLSFALPTEDFISTYKVPKRNFDIPGEKVDVVFFQKNLLRWHTNTLQRISPFIRKETEAASGETLLDNLMKKQDIMRQEALKLQEKSEKGRRRARERRPDRSKEQARVRRLHATLAVAYEESLRTSGEVKISEASRVGLKVLGLDHLSGVILRQIQVSRQWPYLLRLEIKKTQARLSKLDEAHLRADKRRTGDAKKYIFDHGIKGVRRVMNKHGTVTNLQQVDHKCPTGLSWSIIPSSTLWLDSKSEIEAWLSTLPKGYDVTLSDTKLVVTAKTLTNVPILLTWSSRHSLHSLAQPTLVYSTGP